ncbi:alpha-L-arabinofuranosidase C-terminal domain-containing protein [uncultured Cellulomonas sp.]|uniref:alpha-L-arabinofuranosidase C-terminal domain-containing protein n=1 Tax=uncultured Cellulomonas sp. TaxID=189682 RepID=UPI00262FC874|nr:alpha-L-arabinofuranosidase C-terminal domain-containing protein [uncultured Cellulomonas sp.]
MTVFTLAVTLLGGATAATAAAPPEVLPEGAWVDEFDGETLDQRWTVMNEAPDSWSLDAGAGTLTLESLVGDTYQDSNDARNLFLVDVPVGDFTAVTSFVAPASVDFQGAGLIAMQDLDNYIRAGFAHVSIATNGPLVVENAVETGGVFGSTTTARADSTGETLRLQRTGDTVTTSIWVDGAWVQAAQVTVGFDITQVGLYALAAGGAPSHTATFDYFAIVPADEPEEPGPVDPEVLPGELTIDGDATGVEMSPDLYGLFYEDINYAADGGLYAELVRNRSFEFTSADNASFTGMTAWEEVERAGATATTAVVTDEGRLNDTNRFYLQLEASGAGAGIRNTSYNTGVPVVAGEEYLFSVWARSQTAQPLTVAVEDAAGEATFATGTVAVDGSGEWKKYETTLTATGSTTAGRLAVVAGAAGTVALDMVSLFPEDQWEGPVNGEYGLREDIADTIAAMNPSFLRFPGGCVTNVGTFDSYVSSDFEDRRRTYQWKETIGPVEERATNWNFWGYNQSYGIGYLEYFKFAEDLGATPLPVVSVGANGCGSTIPEMTQDHPEFDRWVQDTVDLIEFANGDVTTEWGAVRAELGHPEPFGLRYIGLGNEENTDTFQANFPVFRDAIEEVYPDITIISNSGPDDTGARFDELWEFNRAQGVDMVDEHYYNDPAWFLSNTHRYDDYDRDGPHVFLGEYASRGNTFWNALAEAAFMTGIERNSDLVELASYAPLLANEDYIQWSPDAIWFDNDEVWGTPNYYVQQLFANNRGDQTVPSDFDLPDVTVPTQDISGGVFLSTWATSASYDNLQVTGADGEVLYAEDFSDGADDWTPERGTWEVVDGEYRQTSTTVEDARTLAPDAYGQDWTNYTFELQATKEAGNEGFLVGFAANGAQDFYWWNLGGWNNTRSVLERANGARQGEVAARENFSLVTGQTYDIRVEVDGSTVRLYLDDELQLEYTEPVPPEVVHQVVTRDVETGDLLVKVVNTAPAAIATDVTITDVEVAGTGSVIEMTADSLTATNTKADPTNIVPVERELTGLSEQFEYTFPAYSISFLRIPTTEAEPPQGPVFADVSPGHPFYADIRWLADNGLSTGSTIGDQVFYLPTAPMSRQAMAAFMYRYAGATWVPAEGTRSFTDVHPTDPFYVQIEWMAEMGLAGGYADGTFGPTRPVSRQAMAAFLHRAAGEPAPQGAASFTDVRPTDDFAEAIAWVEEADVANGYPDGTFRPATPISRQAMAAFLHRFDALPTEG